jgi:hypothetical protein
VPPPRPWMTLQGGMIAIALAAIALGLVLESGRHANARPRPGYDRARAVVAQRGRRPTSGGYRTHDPYVVIGVVAAAIVGSHLGRRLVRTR